MSIWVAKAFVQKGISFLPYKYKINYLFQKYVTGGVLLTDALMDDKLAHTRDHLNFYRKYGSLKEGFSSLELGTGWYPIVPIGLYLSGAGGIYSIDIADLLTPTAIRETIAKFLEYEANGKLATFLGQFDKNRLGKLKSFLQADLVAGRILENIQIHNIVGDARSTGFPGKTFDLIHSNNTFEHIHPEILKDILNEFKRVLKPEGIMSHFIDMSDHFAHLDRSITIYNYLQYSDAAWKWIDNSIQPQNRLRITDYRELFSLAGMEIIEEVNRPGSLKDLGKVKTSGKYRNMPQTDLAISHCLIISRHSGKQTETGTNKN